MVGKTEAIALVQAGKDGDLELVTEVLESKNFKNFGEIKNQTSLRGVSMSFPCVQSLL